ncbi:nucleotidyl transferase AbiEii/AbiGii toxin family protein [Patescibacteria group bacterium]|nr:nucleotidyl transferase AbiEii/AbiGii toxin family protein [Patescibacteria group bacterium]MBU1256240.1 nucleotidyl transferase AbiEii/AbiGii toxin family protein [Patescibacteria group bacterium]MBU1457258.1 nucleotidyl transferase AbiEii/AbiGii toxin family protein [Patescibacteria group bacterium]
MIDENFLKNHATKSETSLSNILREYVQHLFLKSFYSQENSQNFLFKGGTALRLAFGSPRFSEDLDFSGEKNSNTYEKILETVLIELSTQGIGVDLKESKLTSGGHLAVIEVELFNQKIEIQNQISFRPQDKLIKENVLIASNIFPSYSIYLLDRKLLIAEKVAALLDRSKVRDFFDLYFILRKDDFRPLLKIDNQQRKKILELTTKLSKDKLAFELKRFLPKSFWQIIKDLPTALKKELAGV